MSDGGEKGNGATGLEALADQAAEIPIPGPDEVDPLSVQGPGLDSPLVSPAMPMGGQRAPRPPTALDRAVALQRAGRLDEAIQAYDAMLRNDPGDARVWLNLGVALRARNRLEAAAACYRRAIALDPQNAGAHSNLGNVLRLLGRHQEATQCQHRALELDPNYHAAAYNMALVLHDVRLWREALRFFDRALAGGYDRPEVRLDRATTLLCAGDYDQGFAELEHRLRVPGAPPRLAPVWDGGPLDGKSILVRLEAGARDALMFLRYVPALAARGARVAVLAPAPMAGVIATIRGVAAVHVPGAEPAPVADLEVALNSLPHRFATTLETVPSSVPYLGVPAGREAREWAPPAPGARLKVGIVWADRAADAQREDRACPFVHFLRLAGIPGVALYRLQTGPAAADRDRAGAGALVRDIAGEFRDLADAAEAITELDLIVGVDSSAMVLAGALGKTGFAVLPTTADWRWTDDPERTPWLPTLRLFRQRRPGDWDEVFARVADALAAYAAAARPAAAAVAAAAPAAGAVMPPVMQAQPAPAAPSAAPLHALAPAPVPVPPPLRPRPAAPPPVASVPPAAAPPPVSTTELTPPPQATARKPVVPAVAPPAAASALPPAEEPTRRARAPRQRARKSGAKPASPAAESLAAPAAPAAAEPPRPTATETPLAASMPRGDEPGLGASVGDEGAGGQFFAVRRFLDEHLEPGDALVDLGGGGRLFALTTAARHGGRVRVIALDPDAGALAELRSAAERSGVAGSIETINATLGAQAVGGRPDAPPVLMLDGLLHDRPAVSGRVFLRLDSGGREPEIVAGGIDLLARGRIGAILWRRAPAYDEPAGAVRFARLLDDLGALGVRHFRLPDDNLGGPLVPYAPIGEPATIFSLPRGFERKRDYADRSPAARPTADARHYAGLDQSARRARTAQLKLAGTSDASRWADPANIAEGAAERASLAAPHLAPHPAPRVLDLGAGALGLKENLPAGAIYLPADLVPRSPESLVVDLNQGDFPPGVFDAVALLEVLEFLHDPLAVLKRARAAARRLVLTYRLSEGGDAEARAAAGWFNAFSRSELEAQLAMAGWVVAMHRREGPFDLFVCDAADPRA